MTGPSCPAQQELETDRIAHPDASIRHLALSPSPWHSARSGPALCSAASLAQRCIWPDRSSSSVAQTHLAYPDRVSDGGGLCKCCAVGTAARPTFECLARAVQIGHAGSCDSLRRLRPTPPMWPLAERLARVQRLNPAPVLLLLRPTSPFARFYRLPMEANFVGAGVRACIRLRHGRVPPVMEECLQ
jgi:hypothetical protein